MRGLSRLLKLRYPVFGNLKLPRSCSEFLTRTRECFRVGPLCWGALPQEVPDTFFGDAEYAPSPRPPPPSPPTG